MKLTEEFSSSRYTVSATRHFNSRLSGSNECFRSVRHNQLNSPKTCYNIHIRNLIKICYLIRQLLRHDTCILALTIYICHKCNLLNTQLLIILSSVKRKITICPSCASQRGWHWRILRKTLKAI